MKDAQSSCMGEYLFEVKQKTTQTQRGSKKQTSENGHLLFHFSDVQYSNGSPVFRPTFDYQADIKKVV